MAPSGAVATVERTALPPEVLAPYMEMLLSVPRYESDGGAGMVAAILGAESWEDLQGEAANLPNVEDVAGKRLRVDGIMINESDEAYDDGTGFYVIVKSVDTKSGEVIIWQSSALTVKAKLVKLHCLNEFPVIVEAQRAAKATKNGQYPYNLNVLAKA